MVDVPWPKTNNPGQEPSEGTGKLINVFMEERGDGTPVWRRAPGAVVFARAPSSGSINLDFDANARGGTFFSTFFELVGSTTTTWVNTASTSQAVEITYPTGTVAGDLVFIAGAGDIAAQLPTTSDGFTQVLTTIAFMHASLMWKISTGESTASYISRNTTGAPNVALTFAIRGADQTNPICDTGTQSTGASGDPSPAAFTATTANSLLMTVAWVDDDVVTQTTGTIAPTTLTVSGATTFGCGGELLAVSTGTANTDAASVLVAFRPMASTIAITAFSTWTSPGTDDEWLTQTISIRHD